MKSVETLDSSNVFSPDQVEKLWKRQFGPFNDIDNPLFHPYTCANRGDGKHRDFGGDEGMLIPTIKGWICPCCDYKQGWAHQIDTEIKS